MNNLKTNEQFENFLRSIPAVKENDDGGGIIPSGTKNIAANGKYDVSYYEFASVNIPQPQGQKEIIQNGIEDVTEYATVNVNVNVPEPSLCYIKVKNNSAAPVQFLNSLVYWDGKLEYETVTIESGQTGNVLSVWGEKLTTNERKTLYKVASTLGNLTFSGSGLLVSTISTKQVGDLYWYYLEYQYSGGGNSGFTVNGSDLIS